MSLPTPSRAVPGRPAVPLGRVLAVLLAGLAGACLVAPATAAREPRGDPDVSSEALALLAQAARAVYEQPYSGRQQVRVSSPDGEREVVVDVRNCPGRELVLRMPPTAQQPGGTFVEPSAPEAASLLPGIDRRAMLLLDVNYALRVAGPDEVVGRPATLVELRRADGRLAARFWIDDATKLPLQREVRDGAGRVVRASTFSSLELGQPEADTRLRPAPTPSLGRPVDGDELFRMRIGGWVAPAELAAGLGLYDARLTTASAAPALHLSYSDGLSTVSLFEQAGRLDTGALDGWSRQYLAGARVWVQPGLPERVSWSAHGRVYTVVSDDRGAIEAAIGRLPHETRGRGVLERLRHGLARVMSWVNPFS